MIGYDSRDRELAIVVDNLSKAYASVRAVDQLQFTVRRGEIFGLLGPNGAGKTTTLACIEGLVKADGGRVLVNGVNPATDPTRVKRSIGVQLQHTSLLPELNVDEQIRLFAALYGRKLNRPAVYALLERVALSEKANALPAVLSGGQQQRLALALALVGEPDIVILDEPTAGLDPQARHRLWEMIRELRHSGRTIILTTHYMEEAEALCDRVGVIDHGTLLALDTPAALVASLNGYTRISLVSELDLALAQTAPGVQSAWREDKWLHIHSDHVPATITALHELAGQHGAGIDQISVHQPNLEEVFLKLTGRSIRA